LTYYHFCDSILFRNHKNKQESTPKDD